MTETTAGVAYDPIPDLAHLLCATERMAVTTGAVEKARRHLYAALSLPELARTEEAEVAIRKALTEAADGGAIREGTRVRLIDPPGSRVPCGAVGIAEEEPDSSGLFWARFPQGRMDVRVSEVEIVAQEDPS